MDSFSRVVAFLLLGDRIVRGFGESVLRGKNELVFVLAVYLSLIFMLKLFARNLGFLDL